MEDDNLNFKDGLKFLSDNDGVLRTVIKNTRPIAPSHRQPSFEGLVKIIVSQQLSGRAADTIFSRLEKLFCEETITPQSIRAIDDTLIKSCGISNSKVSFIRNLQIHFDEQPNFIETLSSMEFTDMHKELIKLKGIGEWSARIFALFHLRHPDVFAYGDNTIYTAIDTLYGEDTSTNRDKLELLIKKWSPHNSTACILMWQWIDSGKPTDLTTK